MRKISTHRILTDAQILRGRLWHLFFGILAGAGLAISVMFPNAAALERTKRDIRVNALFLDLGKFLCKEEGGFKYITPVGNDRYRFDCHSGTAIEERVIFK